MTNPHPASPLSPLKPARLRRVRATCGPVRRALQSRSPTPRRGLSLLETILAVAILAMSMAAVGELIRTGIRAASKSQDLALAQMIAESRMSEILAGAVPASSSSGQAYELDPDWQIDVSVDSTGQPSLLAVTVVAYRSETSLQDGVEYSLTQWMIDPELVLDDAAALDVPTTAASSSDSSGGTP